MSEGIELSQVPDPQSVPPDKPNRKKIFPDDPDVDLGDLRNFGTAVRSVIRHFQQKMAGQEGEHIAIVEKCMALYDHMGQVVRKYEGIKDGWHRLPGHKHEN